MKGTVEQRAKEVLAHAQQQAKKAKTWIDLHNALYGIGGKCCQLFPTPTDRAQFAKTPEYQQVAELMSGLPSMHGQTPAEEASGQLRVRMPRSIHAALIEEAKSEGVSLNQLILSKISFQLRATV